MTDVVLLGPQRFRPTLDRAVASLGIDGAVATVSAGWREREPDDAELDDVLGERSVNLRLYGRWTDTARHDPEYADAERQRRDRLEELQSLHLLRLHHAVATLDDLRRRGGSAEVVTAEQSDAIDAIRRLDAWHLDRVAEVHAAFADRWRPAERPVIAEHRAAVSRLIDRTDAVAIAGGHVGVLLACLRLFGVADAIGDRPVVAWSAGAMAVCERIVLYHDLAAHSPAHAEVFDAGLGLCRGVVPLPHARRRLRLGDRDRMSLLARRFAPARCVVLDDGARVHCPGGTCPPDVVTIGEDGQLRRTAA